MHKLEICNFDTAMMTRLWGLPKRFLWPCYSHLRTTHHRNRWSRSRNRYRHTWRMHRHRRYQCCQIQAYARRLAAREEVGRCKIRVAFRLPSKTDTHEEVHEYFTQQHNISEISTLYHDDVHLWLNLQGTLFETKLPQKIYELLNS